MYQVTNVYAVCAFAAIGGGLFGFDISSIAAVLDTNAYKHFFGFPISYVQGAITCSMPAGSIFGSIGSSIVADRYSRKVAIQAACILWIIGSAIQAGSTGIPMLVVGRAVSGLGVGSASTIVPIYQAEIAPKEIRGRVITLQQWAITWGILIQYFIQYGASFVDGGPKNPTQSTAAFRIPWGLQMIPGFILLVGMKWLPYSPRWLASRDRWEEAIKVLASLHGDGDVKSPKVLAQYREIEEALKYEQDVGSSGWTALLEPQIFKRLTLGMAIQLFSETSGVNIMMFYINYIMQSAKIASPLLTASIQYIINVVMTIPALLWLDKWGRRPLFLIGSLLMAIFLFISGGLQAGFGHGEIMPNSPITWVVDGNPAVSKAIVACSYLFVATFATTWGPGSWTYPAEIFPNKVRAKAVALSTASTWVGNCAIAFAVPPLLYNINWKMYMIFGAFNVLSFVYIFLFAPETKNYALEEMDGVFYAAGNRPWQADSMRGVSDLDELEKSIACGDLKVTAPGVDNDRKPIMVETVIEMTNMRRTSYGSEGSTLGGDRSATRLGVYDISGI